MNIKSSQTLVLEALKKIKTISPKEALKLSNDNECNLIDIRDIRELKKEGTIENSQHMPRGMLEFWVDPESPYSRKIDPKKPNSSEKRVKIKSVCFSGKNSK